MNNKKCYNDPCKPVCNPCNNQPIILYCGQPIDCLDIKKGDILNKVIKKIGDKVCQLDQLQEIYTYTNIIPATDEQCPNGGYVFQEISYSSGAVESETIICNDPGQVDFNLDGDLIQSSSSVNLNSGEGINISAEFDPDTDTVNYTIDLDNCKSITYNEGLTLISNSEVECNTLYHINDRGYYLKGLNSNSFSISGHRLQRVIKSEYYFEQNSTPYKGVYNPYRLTSATTGDVFVYGTYVWQAISNVATITPTNDYNLGTGFIQLNDDLYYSSYWFEIEYDYLNDFIVKQTDLRNNVVENTILTVSPLRYSVDFCDWGQLKHQSKFGNILSIYFNNYVNNTTSISTNRIGRFKGNFIRNSATNNNINIFESNSLNVVTSNKITVFTGNMPISGSITVENNSLTYLTTNSSTFIRNNSGESVIGNVIPSIINNYKLSSIDTNVGFESIGNNVVDIITGNSPYDYVSGTTLNTQISKNKCYAIANNQSDNISSNVVKESIQENRITTIYSNIANNILTNEGDPVEESVIYYPTISLNNIRGNVENNFVYKFISYNVCLAVVNNDACEIQFNSSPVTSIDNNINGQVNNNSNSGIISNNQRCLVNLNKNNGDISLNVNSNISTNGNNGHINRNNNVAPVGNYDIIFNNNNGYISNNQPTTTGLQISNNTNNGRIGNAGTPVSRGVTISDTITNK